MELEENIRRKDLTRYERSRAMVQAKEVAAEVDKRAAELVPKLGSNPGPGRPDSPGSTLRAAERLGVPRQSLERAEQHVAVEKYPEVNDEPQSVAITYAKAVEAEPELRQPDVPPRCHHRSVALQYEPHTNRGGRSWADSRHTE